MPICTMKELLAHAETKQCAVGAFNVGNMEMLLGVVKAAEDSGSPIIIQIAEKRLRHSPLELMAPMMVNAAKHSKAHIAVQLDHGVSPEILRQAMDYGFTSIMFDGSSFPLQENIQRTREMAQEAAQRGVDIEAEIGVVGGSEGGEDALSSCANLEDAVALCEQSACTALAVAIGNAHGHYNSLPKLNFSLLAAISQRVSTPLVLHGGTGISDEDFKKAIQLGIRKINVATAIFDALVQSTANCLKTHAHASYFDLNEAIIEAVYHTVRRHIAVFNCTNKPS